MSILCDGNRPTLFILNFPFRNQIAKDNINKITLIPKSVGPEAAGWMV